MSIKIKVKEINEENFLDYVKYWTKHPSPKLNLIGTEESLLVSRKRAIINFHWMAILNKYGVDIRPEFLFLKKMTNKNIHKVFDSVYKYLISDLDKYDLQMMRWDFWYALNFINNFSLMFCQEYLSSSSFSQLFKLREIPEIKHVLDKPINYNSSIADIEEQINKKTDEIFDALIKTKHEDNSLRNLTELDLISKTQISHILSSVGFRTDVDDRTIPYPIKGNYLDGLIDELEVILEALSAKKTYLYTKTQVSDVQYFNRKLQLCMTFVKTLYPGDCGTDGYKVCIIDKNTKHIYYGKYIRNDDKSLTLLDENNIDKYVGKAVSLRSATHCYYKDGVCEVCGGRTLSHFILADKNVGYIACLLFLHDVVQGLLSAKHYSDTNTMSFRTSEELIDYLTYDKTKNELYLKKNNFRIGFPLKNCQLFLGRRQLKITKGSIKEYEYGAFSEISLEINNGEERITDIFLSQEKDFVKLSKDMIMYMLDDSHIELDENTLWVNLSQYDPHKNIFIISEINKSIIAYFAPIKKFLETGIKDYEPDDAVDKLASLIYPKANINISITELIIKSYMCESELGASLESGEEHAILKTMDSINTSRGIGSSLAYQDQGRVLKSPLYYMIPRDITEFDYFLNMKSN